MTQTNTGMIMRQATTHIRVLWTKASMIALLAVRVFLLQVRSCDLMVLVIWEAARVRRELSRQIFTTKTSQGVDQIKTSRRVSALIILTDPSFQAHFLLLERRWAANNLPCVLMAVKTQWWAVKKVLQLWKGRWPVWMLYLLTRTT